MACETNLHHQYPNLFNDSSNHLCKTLYFTHVFKYFEITGDDVPWLAATLLRLKKEVADAAGAHNWQLIEAPTDFNTHGYCASKPWIVAYEKSLAKQGDDHGTLHPNLAGQTKIADAVYAAVRGFLSLP